MTSQQIMTKVTNRSMTNVWSQLKLARKTPEKPFYCQLRTNFTQILEDLNDGTGVSYVNSSD